MIIITQRISHYDLPNHCTELNENHNIKITNAERNELWSKEYWRTKSGDWGTAYCMYYCSIGQVIVTGAKVHENFTERDIQYGNLVVGTHCGLPLCTLVLFVVCCLLYY